MAGAPGTIGSQVPPGPDEVWRQIAALQQQAQQALAFAANAQATSAQLAANVAALAASGTTWAGPVASPSNVTAAGNITAANVTGGNVFAQSLATIITAGRVALWGRTSDGYIATASSSLRFKTNVTPVQSAEIAAAVLKITVSYFQYIHEVSKRDDPDYDGYVGPEYHVGTNMGAIAEQLHELGLWEFVVYSRDENDNLILDDNGEPIPDGIHDILLCYGLLCVVQEQSKRLADVEARLAAAGL